MAADTPAKHVGKGMNECKGKGGCQVPLKAKKALRMKTTEVA